MLLPAREETPAKINPTAQDLRYGPQHEGPGPGSPLTPVHPQKGWHSMQPLWARGKRRVSQDTKQQGSHSLPQTSQPVPNPPVPSYKSIYSKITRALHFKQQAKGRQWPDWGLFNSFSGGHRPGLSFWVAKVVSQLTF